MGMALTTQGYYGDRVALANRAVTSSALLSHIESHPPLAVTRIRLAEPSPGITHLSPEDALIFTLSMKGAYRRELHLDDCAKPIDTPISEGSFAFLDKRRDAGLIIKSPLDCVQFYIPISSANTVAYEGGLPRIHDIRLKSGDVVADVTMRNLADALVPVFIHPERVNQLFIDCVTRAVAAHVADTYGKGTTRPRNACGGLAPWQERRATEILIANLDGNVPLAALAQELGLSVGHFARAFRQSTGVAPHKWLMQRRPETAQRLLRDRTIALSDVAVATGFADQSHFTQAFSRSVGVSPGLWRRRLDQ